MNSNLIHKSLKRSISYPSYRTLIKDLILENKSTGPNQSDILLSYSVLNSKRMDRLDKTLDLTDNTKATIDQIIGRYTFLVIAEGWCGDAAQILPIINKVADYSQKIDMKIVLRDENTELMDRYLTNGARSVPKIIVLDNAEQVVGSWGPRPSVAAKMVKDYKAKNGVVDATLKKDLQLWYNKDKGHNTQSDLLSILRAS